MVLRLFFLGRSRLAVKKWWLVGKKKLGSMGLRTPKKGEGNQSIKVEHRAFGPRGGLERTTVDLGGSEYRDSKAHQWLFGSPEKSGDSTGIGPAIDCKWLELHDPVGCLEVLERRLGLSPEVGPSGDRGVVLLTFGGVVFWLGSCCEFPVPRTKKDVTARAQRKRAL